MKKKNKYYTIGKKYMYKGKYNKAIDYFIKYLSFSLKDEKEYSSMYFISRCYIGINRINEARMWLYIAIKNYPYLKDAYMERAVLEYRLNNYKLIKKYCLLALKKEKIDKYNDFLYTENNYIYDLLSVAYFYLNKYLQAYKYVCMALSLDPKNKRIRNNLILIYEKLKDLN